MNKENKYKSIEAQRFIDEVQAAIKRGESSSFAAVAVSSGYSSQDFTDIKAGKKDLKRDFLESVAKKINIDKDFVLTGKRYLKDGDSGYIKLPRIEAIPRTVLPDMDEFEDTDHKFAYSDEGVVAMRVRIVPAKAQLGYLRGYADPEYFDRFDYEIIPVSQEHKSTYLGFETVGYSMVNLTTEQWAEKSIFPNRIAIGRELDRNAWRNKLHIHSNDAWIIAHKTDGILLKEIIKHDTETGIITTHSWNPDKEQYPDRDFHLDDIAQLFNVLQVVDKRR